MKRVSVILLTAFAVLALSAAANAEMVYLSQDFDNTGTFTADYQFGSLGDAATTTGLWGSYGAGDKPVVVTDRFHSGTQSVKVSRPSGSYAGYRFYGTTTYGEAPFSEGQFSATTWLNMGDDSIALVYVESYADATASSPAHHGPGLAMYESLSGYAGVLRARAWDGSAWTYVSDGQSYTQGNTWFGVKFEVDLENSVYDVLLDTGSGFVERMSNVALDPNETYALDSMVFYSSGARPSYLWVDDCEMIGPEVPEPSTLALLACGLVGLLAYAWRKRK